MARVNARQSGCWISCRADAERLSKADWMDVYFDLFVESGGHEHLQYAQREELALADAGRRLGILRANGICR